CGTRCWATARTARRAWPPSSAIPPSAASATRGRSPPTPSCSRPTRRPTSRDRSSTLTAGCWRGLRRARG
ncbi:MAG: hypothetical protein AVDCRST_MAG91-788, partial [uncultured Sphingomonadaceae bacterium]